MKIKVIGIALVFGLLAGVGACSQPGGDGVSPSPAESPVIVPPTSP